MKTVSGRQFARVLEAHGWTLLRISRSHHIYGKPGERARLSVPIHGSDLLKAGLQNHLMKAAGLTDEDLAKRLVTHLRG